MTKLKERNPKWINDDGVNRVAGAEADRADAILCSARHQRRGGWNAGFGIAELMKVNGMGVTTGDDATLVSSDANSLFNKVAARHGHADFSRIKTLAYRPFDGQLVYYDAKLLARAREKFLGKCFHAEPQSRREEKQADLLAPNGVRDSEDVSGVSREQIRVLNENSAPLRLCEGNKNDSNIALCLIRINSKDNGSPVFVTDKITDKTILSSKDNANIFPLYLYEENMGKVEKRANLDKDIVAKLCASASLREEEVSPESIFDYIYGVLHSPSYRAKFKEFLCGV